MASKQARLTGSMPHFWVGVERRDRLDSALLKAWKYRRELPFDTQENNGLEEQNLKWRLISVWYFGRPMYDQEGLATDVMEMVYPEILAFLKGRFTETHYKSFDFGFIYERLSKLLNSTEETQEIIDRYDLQELGRFTQTNTSALRNRIHCLYWFGEMTTDWLDKYSQGYHASQARLSRVTKAWGSFDATPPAIRSPFKSSFEGVFRLKDRHVELIRSGGTLEEVDEMGEISDEE